MRRARLAAASNACGLTAQTMSSAASSDASRPPSAPSRRSGWRACAALRRSGSTTMIERPGRPALTRPPTSACAMLPPPMKTMLCMAQCKQDGRSSVARVRPAGGRAEDRACRRAPSSRLRAIAASRSSLMPVEACRASSPSRAQRVEQLAQRAVRPALRVDAVRRLRDRHQAAQPQPRQRGDRAARARRRRRARRRSSSLRR